VPTEGIDRLPRVASERGLFRAHDVVVTPGAQAGLSTVMRVPPGGRAGARRVATFLGTIAAARMAGGRVVPVPWTARVTRSCLKRRSAHRAKVFVCQPLYATHTARRAGPPAELLAYVRDAGRVPGEDD